MNVEFLRKNGWMVGMCAVCLVALGAGVVSLFTGGAEGCGRCKGERSSALATREYPPVHIQWHAFKCSLEHKHEIPEGPALGIVGLRGVSHRFLRDGREAFIFPCIFAPAGLCFNQV